MDFVKLNSIAAILVGTVSLAFAGGPEKKGPKTVNLADASYTKLRDQVRPNAAELAWQKIAWRSSVWDGIVEGQTSDKPILIWMLNGHPLACT
jgi:hypothetical protein